MDDVRGAWFGRQNAGSGLGLFPVLLSRLAWKRRPDSGEILAELSAQMRGTPLTMWATAHLFSLVLQFFIMGLCVAKDGSG